MRLRSFVVAFAAMVVVVSLAASPAAGAGTAVPRVKNVCAAPPPGRGEVHKVCSAANGSSLPVETRANVLGGGLGGAAQVVAGSGLGSSLGAAAAGIGLAAIALSVVGGAKFALHETAVVLGDTSSPQLQSTWFSSTYWRVAGISVLLTLPFLFAAAIQALLRSDLTLLLRAAFGYLPLAMLAVSIAAPMTMLLLAAADQLSAIVSSATGNASDRFVNFSVGSLGELTVAAGPFMALFLALFVVTGAVVLWIELLMREAAVYVIVLMLPLAFAGMVWPARRIWAIRAIELLVALVMSKFAIVAVLSLGGAALSAGASPAGHSVTGAVAGAVLLLMGAFTPWALLRLLPLAEVASSAAGSLSRETRARGHSELASLVAHSAPDWTAAVTARLRDDASAATPLPPAASEKGPIANATPVTPRGGERVATRDGEVPEAQTVEAKPEAPATYEMHDIGIDEMWEPEHQGKWAP